jgi:tetratricopeptide (TPR) repeat protein
MSTQAHAVRGRLVPAPSPWILGPGRDLLLFIATPAVILPITLLLLLRVESKAIQYFVLAFGSLGHNLPGMLRAYGDRALFRRFRTRFVVAPIGLGALAFVLTLQHASTLVVIALLWSIWHALMQVYGFARIYDGKVGAVEPKDARLDLALCVTWFTGAVLFSDPRVFQLQALFAEFGVGPLGAVGLLVVRRVMVVLLVLVTVAYVGRQVERTRSGAPQSRKNLLFLSAIGFYWYVNAATSDVLLGLIMYEVFHDVQYLAIVWLFNQRRAATDPGAGAFTRFVFKRSWGMLGVYIGLVLAYGGLLPLSRQFEASPTVTAAFAAFVTASALLHYYYDGFIWKVRERTTRENLGLAAGEGGNEPMVSRHALKWAALFVPAALLWAGEDKARAQSTAVAEVLVDATPGVADAHTRLAEAALREARPAVAAAALRRAAELGSDAEGLGADLDRALFDAALAALAQDDEARAEAHLRELAARQPALVSQLSNTLLERRNAGDFAGAIALGRAALLIAPDHPQTRLNLALAYRDSGRPDLALPHAERGAALLGNDTRAQQLVEQLRARCAE